MFLFLSLSFLCRIGLTGFDNPMRDQKTEEARRHIGQVIIGYPYFPSCVPDKWYQHHQYVPRPGLVSTMSLPMLLISSIFDAKIGHDM